MQNSLENTCFCVWCHFFIKLKTFSFLTWEFFKTFNNIVFIEHLRVTVSVNLDNGLVESLEKSALKRSSKNYEESEHSLCSEKEGLGEYLKMTIKDADNEAAAQKR